MERKENDFVPRVTQLDAVELDKEVIRVMKSQVATASKYLKVGILGRWEPEIDAALKLLIWKVSVCRANATFGQQLLSVKYHGALSEDRARLLALVTVGTKYVKDRAKDISRLAGSHQLSQTLLHGMDQAETVVQIASLLNLLIFFREGRYPTLADRLLGLRPASVAAVGQRRHIGYSFMLRELLWHGFIELLAFTLPLVNYHYVHRLWRNMFPWGAANATSPMAFTHDTRCAVCKETLVLPYTRGCGHVYCFYCIQSHHMADSSFQCPLCGFSDLDPASIVPLRVA